MAFVFLLLYHTVSAQYVEEKKSARDTTIQVRSSSSGGYSNQSGGGFDTDRLVPGGNFALSFGNPSFVDISPRLGYMVNEKVMVGLGVTYMNFKSSFVNFNFYGAQIFSRIQLFENFYGNAEVDFLNVPDLYGNLDNGRRWLVSPLIGGSYVVPFGKRGGIQATLLYNLNYQQAYSPFPSPVVWRLGFFL